MAELDKDLSQILTQISDVEDTDLFYVGRFTGGVWVDYTMTGAILKAVIADLVNVTPWSTEESLSPDGSHYKNMGSSEDYCGAIIKFVFMRDSKVFFGKVAIINDETDCYQTIEGAYEMPSQAVGIDIPYESQISAGQMQWTITIDDSDAEDSYLQYQTELIPRPAGA